MSLRRIFMESSDNGHPLTLDAKTAADLMQPNVFSISVDATVPEAVQLLVEKDLSAVPVVDENDHPLGVLSRSDIVAHDCRRYGHLQPGRPYFDKNGVVTPLKKTINRTPAHRRTSTALVTEVMTPVVFSVGRDTPASSVVDAMLALMVHRLFVTDEYGSLVGVISTTDVLRHLHQPRFAPADEEPILCLGDRY
jgi:CBS domain-containing protein